MGSLESAFLLIGILGVPLMLLICGHRFRRLGRRMRGAFWGGITGYAAGVVIWALAAIAPAEMWNTQSLRFAAIVLPLLLFSGAGFLVGAVVGKNPARRHRHPRQRALLDARQHSSSPQDP